MGLELLMRREVSSEGVGVGPVARQTWTVNLLCETSAATELQKIWMQFSLSFLKH